MENRILVGFYVNLEEQSQIKEAAKSDHRSVSSFVRHLALEASNKNE